MAVHVTRCPHCQTSFRVRDEHLSAARGMVRCGSCLQVFKAAEHFIDEAPAAAPAAARPVLKAVPTPPPSTPQPAPKAASKPAAVITPADDDDPGLIHDDMDDEPVPEKVSDNPFVDFNLRAPDSQPRPTPRLEIEFDDSILGLRNANASTLDFVDPEKEQAGDDDEAWANALLEEDDSAQPAPVAKKPFKGAIAEPEKPGKSPLLDDDFNFDLPPPEEDDFQGFLDDDDDLTDSQTPVSSFTLGGDDGLEKQALEIPVTAARVTRLQDEPLQFSSQPQQRRRPWGWITGIVLLLAAAAVQTLYFHFDQWARTPQWRPFYSQICAQLECQLPKVQNIQTMTTQHLVVRAHPTLQRALMVDMLLLNKADYEQPFPDLLLVFRDLNDRVIASRRFAPAQYLSGELAGQQDMPVRAPVHIALEVVDPGPEAVSYAATLVSNQ